MDGVLILRDFAFDDLFDGSPFGVSHVDDRIVGAVYVGRHNGRNPRLDGKPMSPFYNPYIIGAEYDWLERGRTASREDVIRKYAVYLSERPSLLRRIPSLRGKTLECWCRHYGQKDPVCHADVLHLILRRFDDDQLRSMR